MGNYINYISAGRITLFFTICTGSFLCAQDAKVGLAQAFEKPEVDPNLKNQVIIEEVEPVVVGRERWDEKPNLEDDPSGEQVKLSENPEIEELEALETKQSGLNKDGLPVFPPKIMPATDLNRNFEGTLVLKPRKLGFENKFPYQLENTAGKRLAFVDMANVHGLNPVNYGDRRVNVLGKLEPVKEGSSEFVIRAKIIRLVD